MLREDGQSTESGLPWHVVEAAVNREIEWLRRVTAAHVIDEVPGCDRCSYTFRKMALLIVSGEVRAREFIARDGEDLWDGLAYRHGIRRAARHGGAWHRRMMDAITEYFSNQGFDVVIEPFLSRGRADLGVYRDGHKDLFIEVGTTSPYKLWWNLQMLVDSKILLVPDENRAIEFTCRDARYDKLRGVSDA